MNAEVRSEEKLRSFEDEKKQKNLTEASSQLLNFISSIYTLCVFCVFLLLLSGCSRKSEEPQIAVPETVQPSQVSSVVISPENATAQTVITLKADSGILNKGEIQWFVNDVRDEASKGARFTSAGIRKGDNVYARVVKGDKEFRSNGIVIRNTPPVIINSKLLPQTPMASSTLTVDVNAEDFDKDRISYKYKWYLNDNFIGEDKSLYTELKGGDRIMVEVTPFDGEDTGSPVRLKNTVYNIIPVYTEGKPSVNGNIFTYQVKATDPDGDTLTYELKEGPDGMTINTSSGLITWKVPQGDREPHDVKVLISDGKGGEVLVPFSAKITSSDK
ncbi:MAG: cadherin repeat domain-containing protein [Nitrospirae bacterium]|nr:cadherin repeat domain-containing protein [Nitrospirota bacterium]